MDTIGPHLRYNMNHFKHLAGNLSSLINVAIISCRGVRNIQRAFIIYSNRRRCPRAALSSLNYLYKAT